MDDRRRTLDLFSFAEVNSSRSGISLLPARLSVVKPIAVAPRSAASQDPQSLSRKSDPSVSALGWRRLVAAKRLWRAPLAPPRGRHSHIGTASDASVHPLSSTPVKLRPKARRWASSLAVSSRAPPVQLLGPLAAPPRTVGRLLAASAALTAGLQGAGCLHGWFSNKTEALYDVVGAVNSVSFVPLALYLARGVGSRDARWLDPRRLVASGLFVLARLWLLLFLGWRAKERGGDSRFDSFKASLAKWAVPWIAQGLWVWCIALPVLVVNGGPKVALAGAFDYVPSALFLGGLLCEVVSDMQKARWVQEGRKGGFCNVGLWRLSRHPNYFGEILMWWAAWGLTLRIGAATSVGWPLLALLSPLFTMRILMFTPATGLAQCEGAGLKRYYTGDANVAAAFKKYRENTSILVPLVGWRHIPRWLKNTLLCEWKRYEFDETNVSVQEPMGDSA